MWKYERQKIYLSMLLGLRIIASYDLTHLFGPFIVSVCVCVSNSQDTLASLFDFDRVRHSDKDSKHQPYPYLLRVLVGAMQPALVIFITKR